jgi:two-component system sensor histidine kinase KdpD
VAVGLVVVALRAVQDYPNPTIAALLLLLVTLGTATAGRLRVAIAISFVAMLAFNFFLLPPFHTFHVADPENWVALMVFVVVATMASHLSAAARQRASERQRAALASALLASFSHDLRTPVTSIRVALANIESEALSSEERRTQARLASSELDRLTHLLDNILQMARLDAAAVSPARQWVTPADLVEAAVACVGPAVANRELGIEADASNEVQVDPRLTSGALAHLIENAARYSPPDTPIEIRGWIAAGELRLAVRDHGPGLEPSEMASVFEPFSRGAGARHATGTGLGLAITRGLLAAERGHVSCENAPDGGALFTIAVPGAARAVEPEVL